MNVRAASKSLTQLFQNPFGFMLGISLEAERAARLRAEQTTQYVIAQAQVASQDAREANEHLHKLENDFNALKKLSVDRMDALERRSGGGSCGTSHPRYDEDLDEESLDSDD